MGWSIPLLKKNNMAITGTTSDSHGFKTTRIKTKIKQSPNLRSTQEIMSVTPLPKRDIINHNIFEIVPEVDTIKVSWWRRFFRKW